MTAPRLVPTGVAARAVGVDRATLHRWWKAGLVEPASITAGGHARWDTEDLRTQLHRRAAERRDNDDRPTT